MKKYFILDMKLAELDSVKQDSWILNAEEGGD